MKPRLETKSAAPPGPSLEERSRCTAAALANLAALEVGLPAEFILTSLRPLTLQEMSARLGVSARQVTDLIEDGSLQALDVGSRGVERRSWRIPAEAYYSTVRQRLNLPPVPATNLRRAS